MTEEVTDIQIIQCTEDWFQIQTETWFEKKPGVTEVNSSDDRTKKTRCTMARVILWRKKHINAEDFFDGVTSMGHGEYDESMTYTYVHGQDISPNGKKWIDVFNEAPFKFLGFKVIPNPME